MKKKKNKIKKDKGFCFFRLTGQKFYWLLIKMSFVYITKMRKGSLNFLEANQNFYSKATYGIIFNYHNNKNGLSWFQLVSVDYDQVEKSSIKNSTMASILRKKIKRFGDILANPNQSYYSQYKLFNSSEVTQKFRDRW